MITARINNQLLNLPLDFTFEIVRNSQLTSFDKLKGDYVPSISFPDTERNRAVLFNPQLFEMKRNGVKEFPHFELEYKGYNLIRGTLVLANSLDGYVKGTAGFLAAANADKLITDYNLPDEQTFENKSSYNPDTDDYCAPELVNPDFFRDLTRTKLFPISGQNTDLEHTVFQAYHRAAGYGVNIKDGSNNTFFSTQNLYFYLNNLPTDIKSAVVCPFLFLFNLINKLLKANNFHLVENEISANNDLQRLALYNNFNIINYQSIYYPDYGNINYKDGRYGGSISIGTPLAELTQALSTFKYTDLLPPVSLKNFILGIQNLLNIALVFNNDGTAEIIDRNNVIEKAPIDLDEYFTGTWEMGEKKDVVLEFEMKHDDGDSLFSERYTDLSERYNDFADDVNTMAELQAIESPAMGELRRVLARNEIYEYKLGTVIEENGNEFDIIDWFFASTDFQNYKFNHDPEVDKEVEKIETSFSTLTYRLDAYTYQMGRCNLRKGEEASFTPRLVFDDAGKAKNTSANYRLNWRGTNNLIDKRWGKWARFWSTREPITGYFRLPAHILQNFDMNRPYRTREGSFLIEKMITQVSHTGIGETKIKGYKL